MTDDPNYVVIRDPDNEHISGRWYDLSTFLGESASAPTGTMRTYVPTPFIEVREDGAVAQVYMPAKEPT